MLKTTKSFEYAQLGFLSNKKITLRKYPKGRPPIFSQEACSVIAVINSILLHDHVYEFSIH